ncbi:MAG: hypothetical protein LIP77_03005 [Planctomycetes bacterium]|nr:hypothetical protein [Planctomycetota bacterium]
MEGHQTNAKNHRDSCVGQTQHRTYKHHEKHKSDRIYNPEKYPIEKGGDDTAQHGWVTLSRGQGLEENGLARGRYTAAAKDNQVLRPVMAAGDFAGLQMVLRAAVRRLGTVTQITCPAPATFGLRHVRPDDFAAIRRPRRCGSIGRPGRFVATESFFGHDVRESFIFRVVFFLFTLYPSENFFSHVLFSPPRTSPD